MNATAVSKMSRAICVKINIEINTVEMLDPVFPSKVIIKCPAIMLADRRIARVPGRIMFLIVSMHTMNGMSSEGVPDGTR